jgi:hypothetical protein
MRQISGLQMKIFFTLCEQGVGNDLAVLFNQQEIREIAVFGPESLLMQNGPIRASNQSGGEVIEINLRKRGTSSCRLSLLNS